MECGYRELQLQRNKPSAQNTEGLIDGVRQLLRNSTKRYSKQHSLIVSALHELGGAQSLSESVQLPSGIAAPADRPFAGDKRRKHVRQCTKARIGLLKQIRNFPQRCKRETLLPAWSSSVENFVVQAEGSRVDLGRISSGNVVGCHRDFNDHAQQRPRECVVDGRCACEGADAADERREDCLQHTAAAKNLCHLA